MNVISLFNQKPKTITIVIDDVIVLIIVIK